MVTKLQGKPTIYMDKQNGGVIYLVFFGNLKALMEFKGKYFDADKQAQ